MILTTRTKIRLAGLAYRVVRSLRRLVGNNSDTVTVKRGGLRWVLDLHEGIDFAIYLFGAFERSTHTELRSLAKPGATVIDIGANIGAHTLPLADFVGPAGKVLAFEPTDYAFAKLRRNLKENPELDARVTAVQAFLSDPDTVSQSRKSDPVYSSWPLEPGEGRHEKHLGELKTTDGASLLTLDDFVESKAIDGVDLIKLDVDGFEYPVLRGAVRTLRRLRPTIVMELSPYVHAERNNSFSELIRLLTDTGYQFHEVGSGKPVPSDPAELDSMIPDGAGINVVARCPLGKVNRLQTE